MLQAEKEQLVDEGKAITQSISDLDTQHELDLNELKAKYKFDRKAREDRLHSNQVTVGTHTNKIKVVEEYGTSPTSLHGKLCPFVNYYQHVMAGCKGALPLQCLRDPVLVDQYIQSVKTYSNGMNLHEVEPVVMGKAFGYTRDIVRTPELNGGWSKKSMASILKALHDNQFFDNVHYSATLKQYQEAGILAASYDNQRIYQNQDFLPEVLAICLDLAFGQFDLDLKIKNFKPVRNSASWEASECTARDLLNGNNVAAMDGIHSNGKSSIAIIISCCIFIKPV